MASVRISERTSVVERRTSGAFSARTVDTGLERASFRAGWRLRTSRPAPEARDRERGGRGGGGGVSQNGDSGGCCDGVRARACLPAGTRPAGVGSPPPHRRVSGRRAVGYEASAQAAQPLGNSMRVLGRVSVAAAAVAQRMTVRRPQATTGRSNRWIWPGRGIALPGPCRGLEPPSPRLAGLGRPASIPRRARSTRTQAVMRPNPPGDSEPGHSPRRRPRWRRRGSLGASGGPLDFQAESRLGARAGCLKGPAPTRPSLPCKWGSASESRPSRRNLKPAPQRGPRSGS